MPIFCRHNRLAENCPVCTRKARADARTAKRQPPPARARASSGRRPAKSGGGRAAQRDLTVRRLERSADDGYGHELVPGLRSSSDGAMLVTELLWSAGRLAELGRGEPAEPGDRGLRAEFERVVRDPVRGAGDERAPELLDAFDAWAARHGGAAAALEGSGSPQARFDRAFERLTIPGIDRALRFELLAGAHARGLLPQIDPWTLRLGDASSLDPVAVAAKRVFGIGDPLLVGRRLRELCGAIGVDVAAADLALFNWSRPSEPRHLAGAEVPTPAPELLEQALSVLALSTPVTDSKQVEQ